jgi:hypothetical protein
MRPIDHEETKLPSLLILSEAKDLAGKLSKPVE